MVVGEEMLGVTECVVEIPADSELIQDGRIEFRFCLPDGREKRTTVSLHDRTPSNPVAEIVSAPFLLVGGGLLLVATSKNDDNDDDDDPWPSYYRRKHRGRKVCGDKATTGLTGIGVLAVGAGLHTLLGGDSGSLSPYEVHVDFNEPAENQ